MTTKPAPAASASSNRALLLRYAGPALWAMAFLGCAVITVFFWFGDRWGEVSFLIWETTYSAPIFVQNFARL